MIDLNKCSPLQLIILCCNTYKTSSWRYKNNGTLCHHHFSRTFQHFRLISSGDSYQCNLCTVQHCKVWQAEQKVYFKPMLKLLSTPLSSGSTHTHSSGIRLLFLVWKSTSGIDSKARWLCSSHRYLSAPVASEPSGHATFLSSWELDLMVVFEVVEHVNGSKRKKYRTLVKCQPCGSTC